MFLFNREQYDTNSPSDLFSLYHSANRVLRAYLYAYDNRYLAEANFGYNGSETLRRIIDTAFPLRLVIGYNISEEDFWESFVLWFPFEDTRSRGLVGNDQTGAGRFPIWKI